MCCLKIKIQLKPQRVIFGYSTQDRSSPLFQSDILDQAIGSYSSREDIMFTSQSLSEMALQLKQVLMAYQKFKESIVVEMHETYPFGQLKQVSSSSEQDVLVRKKLIYQNSNQLQILKKMAQFLGTLQSDYLIELRDYELVSDDKFFFYYQYVPLTLQKWILDLGDDILQELQFEMMSLASYLVQQSIKFHFDPKCLGLSKEIKVKYFLHEFMVDSDKKMVNYQQVEQEIVAFFKQFRLANQKNHETSTAYTDRKSADSALLLNRLDLMSARDSWDSGHRSLATDRSKKNLLLSQKIQNSKRKSMQILLKLKHMKPHSQQ